MNAVLMVSSEMSALVSSTSGIGKTEASLLATMKSSLATLQDASIVIAHGADQPMVADCCHRLRQAHWKLCTLGVQDQHYTTQAFQTFHYVYLCTCLHHSISSTLCSSLWSAHILCISFGRHSLERLGQGTAAVILALIQVHILAGRMRNKLASKQLQLQWLSSLFGSISRGMIRCWSNLTRH